jgi:hypothetical protein
MINDILFCLLGYTGGVFVDSGNQFNLNETIDSVTDSEKELLKKIGEIGFKYKILKDFVKNYESVFNQNLLKGKSDNLDSEDENQNYELETSVFLSAVCLSLNEFLRNYETQIESLENKFYRDLVLTGSEIISNVEKYSNIFDKIYEFLQQVTSPGKSLKGAEFLNYLYECTISGDPEVKNVFRSFFINSNKMILNFITFWIINGNITSSEFFITSANNFTNTGDKSEQLNSYSIHLELESWSANFYIEYSNIPSYIPHSLVEDILFVGKAMKILNSNKNLDEDKIPFNEISIFYTSLQKLNDLVFNEDSGVNILNIELLSKIISLIKSCTAKYLWKLVVVKKGFLENLNAVKNMFLTFNGEFFYTFTTQIKKLLNLPFDKKIENEINEVYFKNSMKEVFNIDTDPAMQKLYSSFRVKLISSGFNYNFENVKAYLEKKEISFIGSFSFDTYSNSLRFINTAYKTQPAAIWNLTSYDVDEEFAMSSSFTLKNFTKPRGSALYNSNQMDNSFSFTGNSPLPLLSPRLPSKLQTPMMNDLNSVQGNDLLRSSLVKIRKNQAGAENLDENPYLIERRVILNYIMHSSKNFEYKNSQPMNLNDLFHYLNFQFIINYEFDGVNQGMVSNFAGNNMLYSSNNNQLLNSQRGNLLSTCKIKSFTFNLKYINKVKKSSNSNNIEKELEIYTKTLTENLDFLSEFPINLQFSFKDNFCSVFNENKSVNFSFPLTINQYIPKDKRKMTIGLLVSSENLDVILDLTSWSFNFFSGEIYNENSNLILMDYNPPWPHNFLFNENILKMYNLIFNLVFPLKSNLTLLNQLWIDKKNIAKKENLIFRLIDSVHSEFVCFLQNLISFYMFDLIDLKFKQFFQKIKDCQDFEQIILSHEEFLGEVIAHSFVKSKKIMRVIFDILFTTRKFYNYIENVLVNYQALKIEENMNRSHGDYYSSEINETYNKEQYEVIKVNLMGIKEEFNCKVKNLIFMFSKIKNTKYFAIISQLMTKLDYQFQTTD